MNALFLYASQKTSLYDSFMRYLCTTYSPMPNYTYKTQTYTYRYTLDNIPTKTAHTHTRPEYNITERKGLVIPLG